MKIAFVVYQWTYGNRPVNSDFTELIEYIKQNAIEKDKMMITGRVCIDLNANDILASEKGSTFRAENFFVMEAYWIP